MYDGTGTNPGMFGDRGSACIQNNFKDLSVGRCSTPVWQNACVNAVRCAMVCDVYFPFPKIL